MFKLALLFGLLDNGHMVGLSTRDHGLLLYHQTVEYSSNEQYTVDGLTGSFDLYNSRYWRLQPGLKLGIEQHYRSEIFDKNYAVASPIVSIYSKNPTFNYGAQLEFGKYFNTMSNNEIGKDKSGYTFYTTGMFAISINLDKHKTKTPRRKSKCRSYCR